jgi:hypothetical protein
MVSLPAWKKQENSFSSSLEREHNDIASPSSPLGRMGYRRHSYLPTRLYSRIGQVTLMERQWIRANGCVAGDCVEVARDEGEILMRDSKDPDGSVLHFSLASWKIFVKGISELRQP